MENQVWHPLRRSILRYSQNGTLQPTSPEESMKCYRLKVKKVKPGSRALHHIVNHTLLYTFTHILGPLASFRGIPVLRGSPPSKRLSLGPGWSTTLDFSARGSSTSVFFHRFRLICLVHGNMENQV